MSIPTQSQVEPELLKALHLLGGSSALAEVIQKVGEAFPELTEEEKQQRHAKSGHRVFKNNVCWGRNSLKQMGYLKSDSPQGIWELSDSGKSKVREILENPSFELKFSNPEKLASAVEEKMSDDDVEKTSQQILQELDPYQFERLCGRMFEKLNFTNVQVTQRSSDKGIDGTGDLMLGLVRIKVVFQAKRYQEGNGIGAPDIQKLFGAMQQSRSEKAVFITTSHFSPQAKNSAKELGIEVIDGERLIEILQKNKIGFVERMEYDIDPGFFKEL